MCNEVPRQECSQVKNHIARKALVISIDDQNDDDDYDYDKDDNYGGRWRGKSADRSQERCVSR